MLPKNTPTWISVGGCTLAVIAGCVNAVGFLGVHHQAISHMSGNVTTLGLNAAAANRTLLLHTGTVIFSFFTGALLSAFIIRKTSLHSGRRYGAVLAIEAALLFAAAHCLRADQHLGDYLLAMACGLQNAMATSYSGAIVRTTHVSGMVTDIGIAVGHYLRNQPVDWQRIRLYATLLTGFFAGSYFGAVSFSEIGYDTLFFPASFAGCAGLAYAAFQQVERQRRRQKSAAASASPSFSLATVAARIRSRVTDAR